MMSGLFYMLVSYKNYSHKAAEFYLLKMLLIFLLYGGRAKKFFAKLFVGEKNHNDFLVKNFKNLFYKTF